MIDLHKEEGHSCSEMGHEASVGFLNGAASAEVAWASHNTIGGTGETIICGRSAIDGETIRCCDKCVAHGIGIQGVGVAEGCI